MLAVQLKREGLHLVTDYPVPDPSDGEALISVLRAGICNTDLEIVEGYKNFFGILGHEFVGRVVRCSSAPDLVGKRVCGELNISCGKCSICKGGNSQLARSHCPRREALGILHRDGAFSQFITLPVANLHPIPSCISDEQAVFVEPLAAACRIVEQLKVTPNTSVAIIGDGKLGLLVAMVLHEKYFRN